MITKNYINCCIVLTNSYFYVQAIGLRLFLETNDKYLSSTNFGYLFENALIYGIIENSEKFVF